MNWLKRFMLIPLAPDVPLFFGLIFMATILIPLWCAS